MASKPRAINNKRRPDTASLIDGVIKGDRQLLARAITLLESQVQAHRKQAEDLLAGLLPASGQAIRIAVTGVPGAGKSTLIETLGLRLVEAGHRLAVLTIDPSSSLSGGSILGDKTRMPELARHPNAFIRPSPASGTLGGVARKTRETMLICEAAGFDVIMVETVGVGQSEIDVRAMVDFFLLVQIAGAGDGLQGIKKGIIEIADLICINKADGENLVRAKSAKHELQKALRLLPERANGWQCRTRICSALTGEGIQQLWQDMQEFAEQMRTTGFFERQRQQQRRQWLISTLEDRIKQLFFEHAAVRGALAELEKSVMAGETTIEQAADRILKSFRAGIK